MYIFWSEDSKDWSPQNHSCKPNTEFHGLDIIALKNIAKDVELTLDYYSFCDESMPEFECVCGSKLCRGKVSLNKS